MIDEEMEINPIASIADETLTDQLVADLRELFSGIDEYQDIVIKPYYEDFPVVSYPMVIVEEIENNYVGKYYDGKEHIADISYQINIHADQSETLTAVENVQNIMNIIKYYMRGERYHALRRIGNTPITKKHDDGNIKIGYMRYIGRLNIDTNTIYRRS